MLGKQDLHRFLIHRYQEAVSYAIFHGASYPVGIRAVAILQGDGLKITFTTSWESILLVSGV